LYLYLKGRTDFRDGKSCYRLKRHNTKPAPLGDWEFPSSPAFVPASLIQPTSNIFAIKLARAQLTMKQHPGTYLRINPQQRNTIGKYDN